MVNYARYIRTAQVSVLFVDYWNLSTGIPCVSQQWAFFRDFCQLPETIKFTQVLDTFKSKELQNNNRIVHFIGIVVIVILPLGLKQIENFPSLKLDLLWLLMRKIVMIDSDQFLLQTKVPRAQSRLLSSVLGTAVHNVFVKTTWKSSSCIRRRLGLSHYLILPEHHHHHHHQDCHHPSKQLSFFALITVLRTYVRTTSLAFWNLVHISLKSVPSNMGAIPLVHETLHWLSTRCLTVTSRRTFTSNC